MIVDVHTHIFSGEVCNGRDCYFDDDHFRLLYSTEKSKLVDHHALHDAMKAGGVDYAVDQHNEKLIDPAVKAQVEKLRAEIVAGKIKVPDYYLKK